jgi:hypothetical protein
MNLKNSLKTSVSDGRDNLRKQIGLNLEKMKTCEGAGALTKEQGGIPNSTTFLYTTGKIVSIVESSKERERPRLGNGAIASKFGVPEGVRPQNFTQLLATNLSDFSIGNNQRTGLTLSGGLKTPIGNLGMNYSQNLNSSNLFGQSQGHTLGVSVDVTDRSPLEGTNVGVTLNYDNQDGFSTDVEMAITQNPMIQSLFALNVNIGRTGAQGSVTNNGSTMGTVDQNGNYEANENFLAEMNGHDIAESVGSFNNANDNKPVKDSNDDSSNNRDGDDGKPAKEDRPSDLLGVALVGGAILATTVAGAFASNPTTPRPSTPNSGSSGQVSNPVRPMRRRDEDSDGDSNGEREGGGDGVFSQIETALGFNENESLIEEAGFCFIAGTKIQTRSGFKNIEEIRIEDEVNSYCQDSSRFSFNKVIRLYKNKTDIILKITLENLEVIETTLGHPFFVLGKGYLKANELTLNDKLMNEKGEKVSIQNLEMLKVDSLPTYNFEVENYHSYFVSKSKILVHNTSGPIELERKSKLFQYRETGIFQSIQQRVSNLFNGKGLNTTNQLIYKEGERSGTLAEYQAAIDNGIKLNDVEKANYKKLKELDARRNELLKKYTTDGAFDFKKMNEPKNLKDKAEYVKILTEEFQYEKLHSQRLVNDWKKEGRTEVGITPFLKKIYKTDIDEFGNPYRKLDLDSVKIVSGGFNLDYWKNKFNLSDFNFRGLIPFSDEPILINAHSAISVSDKLVYNLRPESGPLQNSTSDSSHFGYDKKRVRYDLKSNKYTNGVPGGFDQFSRNDVELLAHELGHSLQQLDPVKWEKTKEQHYANIEYYKEKYEKEGKVFNYRENAYGVSNTVEEYTAQKIIKDPQEFLDQENNLEIVEYDSKGKPVLKNSNPVTRKIFTETRADILKLMMHLKLNRLSKLKILDLK